MAHELEGRRIERVRPMKERELRLLAWDGQRPGLVMEMDDGTLLFPSRDPEGNGPGTLFGTDTTGDLVTYYVGG